MKPVFQTVFDTVHGNCHQAAVASFFDLELSQVPNFILYPDDIWFNIFCGFIYALGYELKEFGYPDTHKMVDYEGVNGFLLATVPKKTYRGITHSVIINRDGVVVHDPYPDQKWLGINVAQSDELLHWTIIEKREL